MNFYEKVVVSPLPRHKYMIVREIRYKDILIPTGFVTNGADIPRVFWSFYPPNRSDYLPAVVVHDYLCSRREYEKGDMYFKEILEQLDIKKRDVLILWGGVRFYSLAVRPVMNFIKKSK